MPYFWVTNPLADIHPFLVTMNMQQTFIIWSHTCFAFIAWEEELLGKEGNMLFEFYKMLPACTLKRVPTFCIPLWKNKHDLSPASKQTGVKLYVYYSLVSKSQDINSSFKIFTLPCLPVSMHMLTIWVCLLRQHSVPPCSPPMLSWTGEFYGVPVGSSSCVHRLPASFLPHMVLLKPKGFQVLNGQKRTLDGSHGDGFPTLEFTCRF